MGKAWIILVLIIAGVVLYSQGYLDGMICKDISDVRSDDMIGETVRIKGVVEGGISIGKISAFTVQDSTGKIGVSANVVPTTGSSVTVSGVLMKDTIFGYYIKADDVRVR